jgi:hypothetical protein
MSDGSRLNSFFRSGNSYLIFGAIHSGGRRPVAVLKDSIQVWANTSSCGRLAAINVGATVIELDHGTWNRS